MKKFVILAFVSLLLTGCSAETFETVEDEYVQSVMQPERTIAVEVEAGAMAVAGEAGTIYLCDGYDVTVQIFLSGDLSGTLQTLSGFEGNELSVFETVFGDMSRFECAWTAAGECGDVAARCVIFDDGQHHYCVTVMAAAEDALSLLPAWNAVLESVTFS